MPIGDPFDGHHQRYEAWFKKHEAAYISELLALRPFAPWKRRGVGLRRRHTTALPEVKP
jgi:hypothetical protein